MRKIWGFLKHHVSEDFNATQYGLIIVFLAVSIALNYHFDFEDDQLEMMNGYPKFIAYFFFYALPYLFAVYVCARCNNCIEVFKQKMFWIKSLFGIFILALDSSAPYLEEIVNYLSHPRTQFWIYKVSLNSMSFFTVAVPILIFYYLYDREKNHLYGLSACKFDVKPYFTMLLIMLPVIIGASFNEAFLRQYPMYKTSGAHLHLDLPEWTTVATYELAYGMDFITVEYLFRGFFVIGMAAILGRGAVITMAVIYCYLHFGKPAGEAISSFFGGYILGVVAYETKSIWGGIIVHMGIAWMMELVSFLRKSDFIF
jgi:membrane protease YdiL (CAAX protease family)